MIVTRRRRLNNGQYRYVNPATGETVRADLSYFHKEEFYGDALLQDGTTKWKFTESSPAGDPNTGAVDAVGGRYLLSIVSTSDEVATARLDMGDTLNYNATLGIFLEAKFQVASALATYAEAEFILGLGAAFNATSDSTASNFWFKVKADHSLVFECDDAVNDNDDQNCETTLLNGTDVIVTADATVLTDIRIYVNGSRVLRNSVIKCNAFTAAKPMQLTMAVVRSGGTLLPLANVDYIAVGGQRAA